MDSLEHSSSRTFDLLARRLEGVPYTSAERGRLLYDFVCHSRSSSILELGCAHGVSTCYLAGGLDTRADGRGSIQTMDLANSFDREPNLFELLDRTGLGEYVTAEFDNRGYLWTLYEAIASSTSRHGVCKPKFDFCFLDGAHSWATDGCAFFLVDKLLRPGGWILFDDLTWTFGTSRILGGSPRVRAMTAEERDTPQVGAVFDLLVSQHPQYETLRWENWGWARKRQVKRETPEFGWPQLVSLLPQGHAGSSHEGT